MAVRRKRTRNSNNRGFAPVVNYVKWFFISLVVVVGVPVLIKLLRRGIISDKTDAEEQDIKLRKEFRNNPEWVAQEVDELGILPEFVNQAKALAHDLGTAYPWYNYKSWTENDKAVVERLANIPNDQSDTFGEAMLTPFESVVLAYYKIAAPGDDLQNDCLNLLDPKEYAKINWEYQTIYN